MILPQAEVFLIFMVLLRVGGLIVMVPMFGGKVIPRQVQLAFAGGTALLVYPLLYETVSIPAHFVQIGIVMIKELFIGVMMGFAVKMVFYIGEFAGSLISVESGLVRSDSFDPIMQTESTAINTVIFYLTAIIIFITGTHYFILDAFLASYKNVPIGATFPAFKGVQSFVLESVQIFKIGLRIAAPIIALSFVINMAFAVLGKAVPKMNVFVISFAVKIMAGLSLLLMTLGLITQYFHRYVQYIPTKMLEFISF